MSSFKSVLRGPHQHPLLGYNMSDPPKGCPIKLAKNSLNSSVFSDILQLSAFSGQIIFDFCDVIHRSCRKTKTEIRFILRYFHFVRRAAAVLGAHHYFFGKIFEIAALTSLKNN